MDKEKVNTDQIVVLAEIMTAILRFGCGRVWLDTEVLYYFYKEIEKIISPEDGFFETIHMMWKKLEKMDLLSFDSAGNYIVIEVGEKGKICNPRELGFNIIYFRYKEQASEWRDIIIEEIKLAEIKKRRKDIREGKKPFPIRIPKISIAKVLPSSESTRLLSSLSH